LAYCRYWSAVTICALPASQGRPVGIPLLMT
jgi:hypothetical protein